MLGAARHGYVARGELKFCMVLEYSLRMGKTTILFLWLLAFKSNLVKTVNI